MLRNQKGFGLLGVILASLISTISIAAIYSAIGNAYRAERGVSANLDLSQLYYNIMLMTEFEELCSTSTLIGTDLTPLVDALRANMRSSSAASPSPTPIAIPVTLGFRSQQGVAAGPMIGAGALFGARKVDSFSITWIRPIGSTSSYVMNLDLQTSLMGRAITNRASSESHLLLVDLDPSNRIVRCQRGRAASQTPLFTSNRYTSKNQPMEAGKERELLSSTFVTTNAGPVAFNGYVSFNPDGRQEALIGVTVSVDGVAVESNRFTTFGCDVAGGNIPLNGTTAPLDPGTHTIRVVNTQYVNDTVQTSTHGCNSDNHAGKGNTSMVLIGALQLQ